MTELVLKLTGDSSSRIRGTTSRDGMQIFSVFDFMTKACNYKDEGNSSRKEFTRLTKNGSEHKEEVAALCRYFKFPGGGQRETPCMTIRGLQRLLLILGGKVAAEFRALVEGVFTRVMAGDQSLIEVINANAVSDAPVQQMYRQALAQEPVAPILDDVVKKRQMQREEAVLELELAEKRQRLVQLTAESQMKSADAQMKVMAAQKMLMESYTLLCPNQVMDDRAKLLFKDNLLNIASSSTPARTAPAITDGSSGSAVSVGVNPSKPITISVLAAEMGYRFDGAQLQKIGRKVSAAYQLKYGEKPGKHEQLVGQASVHVCSYTERDRGLVERAIVDFINE